MLLATVATEPQEAARHTMPPAVMHTHKGHDKYQSTAVVSTGRIDYYFCQGESVCIALCRLFVSVSRTQQLRN